ncbi:MAG: tetratricopeptide repeat protein [Polyangiaceae bacterium]|jgi:Flp pilus assembly protein TadD
MMRASVAGTRVLLMIVVAGSARAMADGPRASGLDASGRPAPSSPFVRLSTDWADADLVAGDDAFERGDLAEAERRYVAARAAAKGRVAAAVGVARVRIARVGVPLDFGAAKGNATVANAAADLQRVVERNRSYGPGFVELGRARLLLGDAQGAVAAMRRGTELLVDDAEAHSELGVGLLATGDVKGAIRELSRAVDLDPGSGPRHGNLGTAFMMAGRSGEAVVEYEARVQIDDGDARAHSDLGTALLATPDLDRAIAELRRAVALSPGGASFHQNLGYALQQAGRIEEAIIEYRSALRLDPKLVSAWVNLATALARSGATRGEARAALDRALALSPNDPRVRANLAELDALGRTAAGDAGATR